MKKLLSLILVLAMVFAYAVLPSAADEDFNGPDLTGFRNAVADWVQWWNIDFDIDLGLYTENSFQLAYDFIWTDSYNELNALGYDEIFGHPSDDDNKYQNCPQEVVDAATDIYNGLKPGFIARLVLRPDLNEFRIAVADWVQWWNIDFDIDLDLYTEESVQVAYDFIWTESYNELNALGYNEIFGHPSDDDDKYQYCPQEVVDTATEIYRELKPGFIARLVLKSKPDPVFEWAMTDKNDGYGIKIPSNAHSYDAGYGVMFYWDQKQKDECVLEIAPEFFETYASLTIVVKASNEYRKLTIPTSGAFSVPKWLDEKGKEQNINMVWIRFND